MLSVSKREIYRQAARRAGTSGYVVKADILSALMPAILHCFERLQSRDTQLGCDRELDSQPGQDTGATVRIPN